MVVSGNILASGYLQPRGCHLRASPSSNICFLYQFPFECVTHKDKQADVGGYNSKRKSLRICFYHMNQIYVLEMSLQNCFSMFVHITKSGGSHSEHYF